MFSRPFFCFPMNGGCFWWCAVANPSLQSGSTSTNGGQSFVPRWRRGTRASNSSSWRMHASSCQSSRLQRTFQKSPANALASTIRQCCFPCTTCAHTHTHSDVKHNARFGCPWHQSFCSFAETKEGACPNKSSGQTGKRSKQGLDGETSPQCTMVFKKKKKKKERKKERKKRVR